MKTSLIAFIIMIVLIVSASNLPAQLSSSQESLTGSHDNIALAAPGFTPTEIIQPLPPAPTYHSAFIPVVSRAFPTEAPIKKAEVIVTQPAPTPTPPDPKPPEPTPAPTKPGPTPTVPVSTAYPFKPMRYQIVPDQSRSWSDYPGPSIWPDLAAPGPVGILAHPEDQINILLLGSDQRPGDGGFRTDTIQLLTINPAAGTVKLTAFPRDLYVYIPGYTMQRINTAFGWGGFDALAETMEYNFGVRPDYYVLANFAAFVDGVNSIGGIFVDVGRDFCDHMDDFDTFCVSQSTYWMNGRIALWYVRARYTTSDLDRGRRQQEVLEAVFNRLININGLYRVPELYDIYKENVTTNIDLNLIIQLLPIAAHLADSVEIGNYAIGRDQVYDWINYSGAMVLVPLREPVLQVMRQAISEP